MVVPIPLFLFKGGVIMKVFCPYVHSNCEDGYPSLQENPCVMWDEENHTCLVKESAKQAVEDCKARVEIQKRFQAPFKVNLKE